ncbi:MAG: hypothetical protein MUC97_09530, partial [Bernardetiaceae bacterium]|nr:hypothetical protein [Bernardetiaceae bacterium]
MKKTYCFICSLLAVWAVASSVLAQDKIVAPKATQPDPAPVVTQHRVAVGGQVVNYTATTGYLTLREENGKERANIFFIA